eukprot:TRINITY_DN27145_c0_g1_i1.p1 TRINITY_DN27145_c0_g1~~TRINITY_DN27145_c0_g1_i1.p1  ORF type:complete len:133 (-),score=46.51 TRINITY_DN27145_c0_g1_i1:3-401(-)
MCIRDSFYPYPSSRSPVLSPSPIPSRTLPHTESGADCLAAAAKEGNVHTLSQLLAAGVAVDARDANGRTALMCAAEARQLATLERLLFARADVDARSHRGETCLLYTSDAADDLLCVDLGGRRVIKKNKHKT